MVIVRGSSLARPRGFSGRRGSRLQRLAVSLRVWFCITVRNASLGARVVELPTLFCRVRAQVAQHALESGIPSQSVKCRVQLQAVPPVTHGVAGRHGTLQHRNCGIPLLVQGQRSWIGDVIPDLRPALFTDLPPYVCRITPSSCRPSFSRPMAISTSASPTRCPAVQAQVRLDPAGRDRPTAPGEFSTNRRAPVARVRSRP